nr:MAG TPA: hypothetical protein [Caudoviricetes sp.]
MLPPTLQVNASAAVIISLSNLHHLRGGSVRFSGSPHFNNKDTTIFP